MLKRGPSEGTEAAAETAAAEMQKLAVGQQQQQSGGVGWGESRTFSRR